MNISADSHLFGSRKGYECLAKSAGVTSGEDRQLSEFGFGQSTDEHFLYGLATQPTAFGRPLSSGRVAITRVMVGPLDDGGRPTLERRTMIVSAADYLAIRHDLKALIKDNVWGSSAFAGGSPIRVPTAGMSRRSAADALAWRIFDAWVIGIESRPPRGVVIAPAAAGGDQARAADAVLALASQLADEDAVKFKWGIRLLSPIEWSDVLTLSSAGVMDGRRPVHGIGAACIKPEVQRAQAASPGMLPTVTSLQRAAIQEAVELVDDGMWDGVGGGGIIPPQGFSVKRKQPKRALIIAAIVLPIIGLTALGTVIWWISMKPAPVSTPAPASTPTPEASPETKPETKPETTPETKPETTPETKPETTPETKPETTPETKPETTPEMKPETTPEAKPETKPETKPVPEPAPAPAPTPTPVLTPTPASTPSLTERLPDLNKVNLNDESEQPFSQLINSIDTSGVLEFPEYVACQKEVDALKSLVGLLGVAKNGKRTLAFDLPDMAINAKRERDDRVKWLDGPGNKQPKKNESDFCAKMDALQLWNHTQLLRAQERVLKFQTLATCTNPAKLRSFALTQMLDMDILSKSIKASLKKPSDLTSQERIDTMLSIMHFCLRLSVSQRFDVEQSKAAAAQSADLSDIKRALAAVEAAGSSDHVGAAQNVLNVIQPLLSDEGLIGQGTYWSKYRMKKSDTDSFLESNSWPSLRLKGKDISCSDLFEALINAVCPPACRGDQVENRLADFRLRMNYPAPQKEN